MLVLGRKRGESIIINENITIEVVDIQGDKIKLGITAPKEIPVHRNEIQALINQAKHEDNSQVACIA